MEPQGSLGAGEGPGVLVPSPRSEAVTHDLEELSLQPSLSLPPIRERKNLQLRLQQRRTREQLVEQGIMPTENFLKHKIRSRPERAELVRMHILQTQAEPSLQATQMKLKRARLADDLNEKIAQRPGPMELVEKNILPYNFDEDSSEALSPEDPGSQESQCSVPSPREAKLPEISSASQSPASNLQLSSDFPCRTPAEDHAHAQPGAATPPATATAPATARPGPTLLKQTQPKPPSERSRSKKSKEPKPRVRKLKYHQYIPPDQKQEPNEAPMDSAYARLLQQQQQFLHLQILSQQQQQHYNYQTILPAPLQSSSQTLPAPVVLSLPSAAPARPNHAVNHRKPGPLPANLDEMKVAELKMELKLRGLPVSGTKTDLIERLKPYQDTSNSISPHPPTATTDTITPPTNQQLESMSTTPPVSPVRSEVSTAPMEESVAGDTTSKAGSAPSPSWPTVGTSPLKTEEMETKVSEKDQRLHEKERQIEELMRKLEQEQRLVEELKMQLEVEKRSQQGAAVAEQNESSPPARVKVERDASPHSCSSAHGPAVVSPAVMKQEEPQVRVHAVPLQHFYLNPTPTQPQPGPHILLPTTIHLTSTSPSPQPPSPCQPTYILPPSTFSNHHSPKSKDPPRYEEAVKQTRALQATVQAPTATSQHMDDLFDVLIESGEISPLIRQDPLAPEKLLPVTASVTMLPINTVLSRPPPQVQVAHPPEPLPSLVALATDHQLEALLEGTLSGEAEPRTLRLMEELHSQLLDQPHSPMDTDELAFSDSPPHSLHLDNMEWLDLTAPGPAGISATAGVFSSDFLDSHDLHWD
uniref:Myocardin related transcription factor B n=1 Tax=Astyanax mexicanus TaxID=7994 RepID=W5LEJ6_ASTMX